MSFTICRNVQQRCARNRREDSTRFLRRRAISIATRRMGNSIQSKALMRGACHGMAVVKFQGRRVLVGWCLRRDPPGAAVGAGTRSRVRRALLARATEKGSHSLMQISMHTQQSVIIQLFTSLSAANDSDSLLLVCEDMHVVRWLESALHLNGACLREHGLRQVREEPCVE